MHGQERLPAHRFQPRRYRFLVIVCTTTRNPPEWRPPSSSQGRAERRKQEKKRRKKASIKQASTCSAKSQATPFCLFCPFFFAELRFFISSSADLLARDRVTTHLSLACLLLFSCRSFFFAVQASPSVS